MVDGLARHADAAAAERLQRFFKTAPGEYGEGDVFIGVRVPANRAVCRRHADLPVPELQRLLDSEVHEHRLAAAIVMADRCRRTRTPTGDKQQLLQLYLRNLDDGRLNSWDLVDVSAEHVIGRQLRDGDRGLVYRLAASGDVWHRRAAVLATFAFIKDHDASTTIALAGLLLDDPHPLIHTATGWMLREVGKRCGERLLTDFLDEHAADMPRTMLRYATERLDRGQRTAYLRLPTG